MMINKLTYLKYFPVLIIILTCNGCWPYHFTEKPGITGTVLDADTKDPVESASVSLTTYSFPEHVEKTETTATLEDGTFSIPAEQKWSIYIVPMDPAPLEAKILVEAEGYKIFAEDFYIDTMGPAITKFKYIMMERLQ